MRFRFAVLAAGMGLGVFSAGALGQSEWINPLGGNFHFPNNWDSGSQNPSHFAYFNLDQTYTVQFTADGANLGLELTAGDVTFDLNTRTYTASSVNASANWPRESSSATFLNGDLVFDQISVYGNDTTVTLSHVDTNPAGLIEVNASHGLLDVRDGSSIVVQDIYLGINDDYSIATMNLSGGSSLQGGYIFVGNQGRGHMNVSEGASVYGGLDMAGYASSVKLDASTWDADGLNIQLRGLDTSLSLLNGSIMSAQDMYVARTSYDDVCDVVVADDSRLTLQGELRVAQEGSGTLTIRDGGGVESGYYNTIATAWGTQGVVRVTGEGSRWITEGQISVSQFGRGRLEITQGGIVRSGNAYIGEYSEGGDVVVSGTGSQWTHDDLFINQDSDTTASSMTINAGAKVITRVDAYINFSYDAPASIIVDGIGTTWTLDASRGGGNLYLGQAGRATLDITNGAVVRAMGGVSVAAEAEGNSHSTLRLSGIGSKLDVQNDIQIGREWQDSIGEIIVADNALLRTPEMIRLRQRSSLTLDGGTVEAYMFENDGLIQGSGTIRSFLSNRETGQMRIAAGEQLELTQQFSNAGTITLLGGTLSAPEIGNDGQILGRGTLIGQSISNWNRMAFSGSTDVLGNLQNDGTIIVSGGATTTFFGIVNHNGPEIRISAGSTAVFLDDVTGTGLFTGTGTTYFEGDLSPGNSPAIVSFGGDVTLGAGASLLIDLGGLIAGETYDRLDIADVLSLDGTLELALLGNFRPIDGEEFEILRFGSRVGDFANIIGEYQGRGLSLDLMYTSDALTLVADQAGPGDADLDGDVDLSDLGALATYYGGASGLDWLQGDFDHDGDVDLNDLGTLATHYGAGAAQAMSDFHALMVPEPSSLALLVAGVMTMRRRGR